MSNVRLPKGLFQRGNTIWIRYYDPKVGYTVHLSSGYPADRAYISFAKVFREERIKESRKPRTISIVNYHLKELLPEFYEKKNVPESTKLIYERATKALFDALGDKPIFEYTKPELEDFFARINLSEQTKGIYSRHLKVIFNFFKERQLLTENPVPKIKLAKIDVKGVSKEDVEMILQQLINKKLIYGYDLIKFLYLSGLRIGEALSLEWKDINFAHETIEFYNRKGKRADVIPIHKYLLEHLEIMRTRKFSETKVFAYTSPSVACFYRVQHDLWGEARYNLHQLRKSFISNLAWGIDSEFVVQTLARHESSRVTQDFYKEKQLSRFKDIVNDAHIDGFNLNV